MGYTGNDYADDEDYDYEYNNNSYPQQSVQMKPNDEWIAPPNPTNKWDEYNNNSTMQMKPDPWVQHPSHYNKPLNTQMKPEEWTPPPHKQTNTWGHHPNNRNGDNTYSNCSPVRQTENDQWGPWTSCIPMDPTQRNPPAHESIKGNDSQYNNNNNMPMNPDYWGSPPPMQSTMQMRPDQRGPQPPRQPAMPMKPRGQPPPPKQSAIEMRPDQRGPPPPRQPAMPVKPNQWGQPPPRPTKPNQWGQPPPRPTKPNQWGQPPPTGEWAPPPPKHNYHQDMPGYGDSFEGQQYDNWNNNNNSSRNGYPGHGKQVNDYQFAGPMEDDAVEVSGGYGAYQGGQQQPQYHYEQNKGDSTTPEWNAKGFKD